MTGKGQSMKREFFIDGILLVDKPRDWTSHDVCAFVKKRFNIKKVGHAGTLDPLATGLLVLLLGAATKQSANLTACDKDYEGVMELGVETDSHDRCGKVLLESDPSGITIEMVREKAKMFTGNIIQVPPMVSALKHKGVRLYKLARQGQEVPREGREVNVQVFDIRKQEGKFVTFFSSVSKGTYVRTLVHDLGKALGCSATLAELRRSRSGVFSIDHSVTIDALKNMMPEELRTKVLPARSANYANTQ